MAAARLGSPLDERKDPHRDSIAHAPRVVRRRQQRRERLPKLLEGEVTRLEGQFAEGIGKALEGVRKVARAVMRSPVTWE